MNIKPLALAATLLAALPGAQVGTTMAVTGVAITLAAPAEAGKSNMTKNARAAKKLARKLKRFDRQQEKLDKKRAKAEEDAAEMMGVGSSPGEIINNGPVDNRPPPYNPNPELGGD